MRPVTDVHERDVLGPLFAALDLLTAAGRLRRRQRKQLAQMKNQSTQMRGQLAMVSARATDQVQHLLIEREQAAVVHRALDDTLSELQQLKQLHTSKPR